jgi:hypothetical protein
MASHLPALRYQRWGVAVTRSVVRRCCDWIHRRAGVRPFEVLIRLGGRRWGRATAGDAGQHHAATLRMVVQASTVSGRRRSSNSVLAGAFGSSPAIPLLACRHGRDLRLGRHAGRGSATPDPRSPRCMSCPCCRSPRSPPSAGAWRRCPAGGLLPGRWPFPGGWPFRRRVASRPGAGLSPRRWSCPVSGLSPGQWPFARPGSFALRARCRRWSV